MARSIHETRKDLAAADLDESQGKETPRSAQIQDRVARKRRLKKQVIGERAAAVSDFPVSPPDAIPIRVRDQGRYVHYPASSEDVRAVLRSLPFGVMDGLNVIEFCLAKAYRPFPPSRHSSVEPDPHTGRLGYENFPGVYMGRVLGTYWPARQRIRVYAYVYDGEVIADRPMWELYLRLKMLSTLIHEAAHHFDHAQRVARGRWLAHGKTKVERYAEKFQHDWVRQYVVPYLLRTYPSEWKDLDAWITHHGGISLPLEFLAGEPRTTAKNGGLTLHGVFSFDGALESLKRHVDEGRPLVETRLQFAEELHWAEYYGEALAILERLSDEFPEHLRVPVLKADILVHQRNYDAALSVLKPMIRADNDNVPALHVLADVHQARRDWPELARVTTRLLDRLNVSTYTRETELLLQRAEARVRLGDYDGATEDLYWLRDVTRKWMQRRVAQLKKEMTTPGFGVS